MCNFLASEQVFDTLGLQSLVVAVLVSLTASEDGTVSNVIVAFSAFFVLGFIDDSFTESPVLPDRNADK